MVQGGRREEGSGWGTRVYLWRIHVDIWQNQYKIVKLKNKIKLKKKKKKSYPEKVMTPHSNTLAWKIPWMEEPGRLQSMGSLRVGHDWSGPCSPSGDLSDLGIKPSSPALAGGFFTTEPTGKPNF